MFKYEFPSVGKSLICCSHTSQIIQSRWNSSHISIW